MAGGDNEAMRTTGADTPAPPPPPPPPPPGPPPRPTPPRGRATGGITAQALQAEIERRNNYPVLRREQADFLPPAFAFRVVFAEGSLKGETTFQEVSGIGADMQFEEVVEGGETRFVHRLPKGVKHKPLVLKRGVGGVDSALVKWCRVTMEEGLGRQILTVPLTVYLLDAFHLPLRAWLFADAYPTQWDIGSFDAMKNEVAIETITFTYTYSNRLL